MAEPANSEDPTMSEAEVTTSPPADGNQEHFRPVKFYMVWNKNGGPPKVTHDTYHQAAFAARSMARKHPGEKFIVLQAVRKFWLDPVGVTEAEQDAQAAAAMASAS